ncbi:MAG: hypothetical protein MUO27_10885, partial [Sedimentisphaerales bacterium]|nr:hypothetical protein [Sedimentisphaerales bacterium]
MIKFKCIYCGQRILAQDEGRGKKGHCPKCRHLLVVPWTTKDRPAISTDTPEKLQQAREAVALWDVATAGPQNQGDLAELWGEKPGWLIPTYDELSLFLMAATLILLYATNAPMREQIYKLMTKVHDGRVFVIAVLFLCGLCLSIYHIFTTREKTDSEKNLMLLFAVLANAGTGIVSAWYVIKSSAVHNWWLVFPIWNIVNSVLLLLMLRIRIINEKCISDRDATLVQI